MWSTADKVRGRDKLAALSIAKETYAIKLDLLSSVHAVQRALDFVSLKRKEHDNNNSSSNKPCLSLVQSV
jgi:hypothetical protein